MKKINYSFCAAIAAAVVLILANFLPGLTLSASELGSSASISCSVWGTSHLAACLNWIAAAILLFVLFCKEDRFPVLAEKNAKLIAFGAAAVVALIAFVIVLTTNAVSISVYGIDLSVSLSGEVMDMIKGELPAFASFGKGLGCWLGLVGAVFAGCAAVLDYLKK